jgi:negative regulator of sigma E activity
MTRDELIMLYCDGELGAAEAAEVRALLASDPSARALAEQLALVGDTIRQQFDALPAVDLADAVLARIDAEPQAVQPVVQGGAVHRFRPRRALALVSGALALAASVAFLVARWGAQPSPIAVASSVQDVAAPVGAISAPEPEPPEQSVAIERVDFGVSQGAIFLVPGQEDRTVVVWTLDDASIWTLDEDSDDKGPEVDL